MTTALAVAHATQHSNTIDRAALRLGLALVTWSRRSRRARVMSHDEAAIRHARALEREAVLRERELVLAQAVGRVIR